MDIFDKVNWIGIETTLTKLDAIKHFKITQLMHNWQNDGRQKQIIERSKRENYAKKHNIEYVTEEDEINENELNELALCPFGCGNVESHQHYLYCTNDTITEQRTQLKQKEQKYLIKQGIHKGLAMTIVKALDQDILSTTLGAHDTVDLLIQEAVEDQAVIGWDNFRTGYLSKKWLYAQEYHNRINKVSNNRDWNHIITKTILNYTYTVWKFRNDRIHGATIQEEYDKKKEQQKKIIDELYNRKNEYELTDPLQINLFKIGSERQKEQGITATENWIELVKMTFETTTKKQRINRQITEWLNRTNEYQEIPDTGLVIPV